MTDQIIEITNQFSFLNSFRNRGDRKMVVSNRDGAYWMRVYQPLSSVKTPMPGTRQLCPWAMAAEITDDATLNDRRQQINAALKSGQKIMQLYDMPANRIMFVEEIATKRITVWVD